MKIYSDDGREFKTIDECNSYESDLKLQKEKEKAERNARIEKARAEAKAKEEKANKLRANLDAAVTGLNGLIDEYKKETGKDLYFGNYNGRLMIKDVTTWGDLLDTVFYR